MRAIGPPAAKSTLEQRLEFDLAMTGGRMPIEVLVADDTARDEALRFLAGRRHARLLRVVTLAEHAARKKARRAAAAQRPAAQP